MQTEGLTAEENSQAIAASFLLMSGPAQSEDPATDLDMKQRVLGNVNTLVSNLAADTMSMEDSANVFNILAMSMDFGSVTEQLNERRQRIRRALLERKAIDSLMLEM